MMILKGKIAFNISSIFSYAYFINLHLPYTSRQIRIDMNATSLLAPLHSSYFTRIEYLAKDGHESTILRGSKHALI